MKLWGSHDGSTRKYIVRTFGGQVLQLGLENARVQSSILFSYLSFEQNNLLVKQVSA